MTKEEARANARKLDQTNKNYKSFLNENSVKQRWTLDSTLNALNKRYIGGPNNLVLKGLRYYEWLDQVQTTVVKSIKRICDSLPDMTELVERTNELEGMHEFPFTCAHIYADNENDRLVVRPNTTIAQINYFTEKDIVKGKEYDLTIHEDIVWLYGGSNIQLSRQFRPTVNVNIKSKHVVPEWLYTIWLYCDINSITLPEDSTAFYSSPFNSKYNSLYAHSGDNMRQVTIYKSLTDVFEDNNISIDKLKENGNFFMEDVENSWISGNTIEITHNTRLGSEDVCKSVPAAFHNIDKVDVKDHIACWRYQCPGMTTNIKEFIYNPQNIYIDDEWEDSTDYATTNDQAMFNDCHIDTLVLGKAPLATIFGMSKIDRLIITPDFYKCKEVHPGFFNCQIGMVITTKGHEAGAIDSIFKYCTVGERCYLTAEDLASLTAEYNTYLK